MKRSIPAVIIAACVGIVFTWLLTSHAIGDTIYAGLIGILALFCAFILVGPENVAEVNISKGMLRTLDEMNRVKQEIFTTEADFRLATTAFAELLCFKAAFDNRWGGMQDHETVSKWVQIKIDEILTALKVTVEKRSEVFVYLEGMRKFDAESKAWHEAHPEGRKAGDEIPSFMKIPEALYERIRDEVEKNRNNGA